MHEWGWDFNQIGAANAWSSSGAGGLLVWAMWAAEGLDYVVAIDDEAFGREPRVLRGYHPDVLDLIHVRWACGTAITAIDLCAAALGREHCEVRGSYELDLGDFFYGRDSTTYIAKVPDWARDWLMDVNTDPEYQVVRSTRAYMTHGRLPRTVQLGAVPPGPHEQRVKLPIEDEAERWNCRDLVLVARRVGIKHVEAFLDRVMENAS